MNPAICPRRDGWLPWSTPSGLEAHGLQIVPTGLISSIAWRSIAQDDATRSKTRWIAG
jgi:hypothetical protein